MRKAGRLLFRFLLAVYLALSALMALPPLFGIRALAVVSGSMQPALPVGSLAYVMPISFQKLQDGDIITYRLGELDTLVTHRVIRFDREGGLIYTKGDANSREDVGGISEDQILGRVVWFLPYLGCLSLVLKAGRARLVYLGIGLLMGFLSQEPAPARDQETAP